MRNWIIALALLASPAHADDLGGVIALQPDPGWKSVPNSSRNAPELPLPTISYEPADGRNASVLVTLFQAKAVRVTDAASLTALHRKMCQGMFSAPDDVVITRLAWDDAVGVYSTFEDPSLVGKPPQRRNYKFSTPVTALVGKQWLLQATIFTDAKGGADFDQALQIIKSAHRYAGGMRRVAATDARSSTRFSLPGFDAALVLPQAGFVADPPNPQRPNYFKMDGPHNLIISGWLDDAADFKNMRAFWAGEKASLEKHGMHPRDEAFKQVGAWSVVTYTISVGSLSQKNLRACCVVGHTWADLHLSVTHDDSKWSELEDLLKSVSLVKKP